MTPDKALAILDSIVSQVTMNRNDHIQALAAVRCLSALVNPTPATDAPTGDAAKPTLVK